MNLRIISDGTSNGTKIINLNTGEDISGVFESITWSVKGGEIAKIEAVLCPIKNIELIGEIKE